MARWILKQAGDISRLCYVTTGLVVCSWLALGLQSQALRLGWNLQPTKPGIDHEKIRLLEIKKKPASKGTNKYPWTPIAYIWLIMFRMVFLNIFWVASTMGKMSDVWRLKPPITGGPFMGPMVATSGDVGSWEFFYDSFWNQISFHIPFG